MLYFSLIALSMLLIPLIIIARVLYLADRNPDELSRQAKINLYKTRLAELENDIATGTIPTAEADVIRDEVQANLLKEIDNEKTPASDKTEKKEWASILIIFISIPAISITTYSILGKPQMTDAEFVAASEAQTEEARSVEDMLSRLTTHLQQQADDTHGWLMLTRAYLALGESDKALAAVEKLHALTGDAPETLVHYIEALIMQSAGELTGKPTAMIQRLLEIEPRHKSGLWLAGLAAEQAGELPQAIEYWQRLIPMMENEPEPQQKVQALIQRAQTALSAHAPQLNTTTATRIKKSINVRVSLADALQDRAAAEDTLFIYAKANQGPAMPLAIISKHVKDLPLEVTLDDSTTMIADMSLANVDTIDVIARISKSGNAKPEKGDLLGSVTALDITIPQETITISIESIVD